MDRAALAGLPLRGLPATAREAFPEHCPNWWCRFPIRELQARQLQEDFVGQHPPPVSGFDLEREFEYLDRKHHVKGKKMSVPKEIT